MKITPGVKKPVPEALTPLAGPLTFFLYKG